MTLPASGSITLGQVLAEIQAANPGRDYPIALGDADVRALAGLPDTGPISLSDLYGKSTASPLTASGHNDSGYASTVTAGGTVYAYPSVTYSGGSGAKSFAWSILSSTSSVTLDNATSAQCRVSKNYSKNSTGSVIAYLRCVVSDSSGSVTVDNIVGDLSWEGNM